VASWINNLANILGGFFKSDPAEAVPELPQATYTPPTLEAPIPEKKPELTPTQMRQIEEMEASVSGFGQMRGESLATKPLLNREDYRIFSKSEAIKHNIDPDIIWAMIGAESSYNPMAKSKKGAKGLMQLMAPAIKDIKQFRNYDVTDPYDPRQSILGGIKYYDILKNRYLPIYFKRYNIDVPIDTQAVLAAYNMGIGDFIEHVRTYGKDWKRKLPKGETKGYISKIPLHISKLKGT
jgi:soluble lytic murein transglycosylase-like protein